MRLDDGQVVPIGEELLLPTDNEMFIINPISNEEVEIKLAHPPVEPEETLQLPMDGNPDLGVYQEYTVEGSGGVLKYNPHRWPMEERTDINVYRNPHVLPVEQLQYLSGVRPEYFWELCQKLEEKDLPTKCNLSIPALLLMVLMRIRHALPFEFLTIMYNFSRSKLIDVFWIYALSLYSSSLHLQQLWSKPDVTDEELDRVFSQLYQRTGVLHRQILNHMYDPSGQKRSAYCKFFILSFHSY